MLLRYIINVLIIDVILLFCLLFSFSVLVAAMLFLITKMSVM